MNNPWYDVVNGRQVGRTPQQAYPQMPASGNPMGLASELAAAMRNPIAFAMNAFRDVPQELWNDPARALQYIQQTRNISQADIQNLINNLPIPR